MNHCPKHSCVFCFSGLGSCERGLPRLRHPWVCVSLGTGGDEEGCQPWSEDNIPGATGVARIHPESVGAAFPTVEPHRGCLRPDGAGCKNT